MKKNVKRNLKEKFFKWAALLISSMSLTLMANAPPAFAAETPLTIQKLVFADEVIGLGQYTPRPKARFTTDDTCRVYLETSGFAMPPVRNQQGEYSVSLTVDIAVKLPQSGRKLVFQPDMATLATTARSKLSSYYMEFAFNFEGWTPRSYALEVGLRDNLGGKTVSQDILLELDEPAEADAKARLEREAATQRGAPGKR